MTVVTFPFHRTKKYAEDLERDLFLWWTTRPFLAFLLPPVEFDDESGYLETVAAIDLQMQESEDEGVLGLPAFLRRNELALV